MILPATSAYLSRSIFVTTHSVQVNRHSIHVARRQPIRASTRRYITTYTNTMVRKSSSTLPPFIIDLRRHHHPRQLSSSPQLRHSFFFVRHEASSHHAAASSSIVFDPNKTVEPPSCHLRHRFNQSTPDRLLPLRDRRSLVCSQSRSFNVTTFISTPP